SNDEEENKTIDKLEKLEPFDNEKINVAVCFGESYFLSLLPTLQKLNIKVVIMADIESRLHQHTRHLLNSLLENDTRKGFFKSYGTKNPAVGWEEAASGFGGPRLLDNLSLIKQLCLDTPSYLGQYHFCALDGEKETADKRYQVCRKAAQSLKVVQVGLNLFNIEQCTQFGEVLAENGCILRIFNSTNIHMYDLEAADIANFKTHHNQPLPAPGGTFLVPAVSALLKSHNPEKCLMLFSTEWMGFGGKLTSQMRIGMDPYFKEAATESHQRWVLHQSNNCSQNEEKQESFQKNGARASQNKTTLFQPTQQPTDGEEVKREYQVINRPN
ncbi:CAF1 family ribonuclease, partial [Coxiella burnetii]|uniref:CAF1 family ribonuclease n=1 Tax=Coxiella burnetii TaxID=777 RepID=UPI002176186B